jgi:hypothetical protein
MSMTCSQRLRALEIAFGLLLVGAILWLSYNPLDQTYADVGISSKTISITIDSDEVELPPFLGSVITLISDGTLQGVPEMREISPGFTISRGQTAPPLTVQNLLIPKNGTIGIRKIEGVPGLYEVSILGAKKMNLFVRGDFEVGAAKGRTLFTVPKPYALEFESSTPELRFRVQLDEARWATTAPFGIQQFEFTDVDEKKTSLKLFSSILSGSIRFPDVDFLSSGGRTLELRPGQLLSVGTANGYARELSVDNERIQFGYAGDISKLSMQIGKVERSLMPSWLAYILSQEGYAQLVWAVGSIYTASLAFFGRK